MERALTVSVRLKNDFDKDSSVEELIRLCDTAGCEVVECFNVRMENYNPAMYIGSGKAVFGVGKRVDQASQAGLTF